MAISTLHVEGLIAGAPLLYSSADLEALDVNAQITDLGEHVPGRAGRGVLFRALFDVRGLLENARWVELSSEEGDFVVSLPIEEVADQGLLWYAGTEGFLTSDDGGPFRLLIPGYRDACANLKHLAHICFMDRPGRDTRPTSRASHAAHHEAMGSSAEHDGHDCQLEL
jgi:DMSO/TMAO reductase YedYZ molybdopterin-dependent catalytic subunit